MLDSAGLPAAVWCPEGILEICLPRTCVLEDFSNSEGDMVVLMNVGDVVMAANSRAPRGVVSSYVPP